MWLKLDVNCIENVSIYCKEQSMLKIETEKSHLHGVGTNHTKSELLTCLFSRCEFSEQAQCS